MSESPTIAEIAALTARLRELTTPGRPVDEAERAAFLADKNALLARITEADHDMHDDGEEADLDGEFDELTERRPLPGDGTGDWVSNGPGGYMWIDLDEMADDPEDGLTGAEGPPLTSGRTRSTEDAARRLARGGRSMDEARAMVRAYQDETSERLGVPVHAWGLDDADLADIGRVPAPRRPVDGRGSDADQIDEHIRWSGPPVSADALDDGRL